MWFVDVALWWSAVGAVVLLLACGVRDSLGRTLPEAAQKAEHELRIDLLPPTALALIRLALFVLAVVLWPFVLKDLWGICREKDKDVRGDSNE